MDRAIIKAGTRRRFAKRNFFALPIYDVGISPVARLQKFRRPSAIGGRIRLIVMCSFYRMIGRRARTYVSDEAFKSASLFIAVEPTVADSHAFRAVVLKGIVAWAIATTLHLLPDFIFATSDRSAPAVFRVGFGGPFFAKTATALRATVNKIAFAGNLFSTAVTSAAPESDAALLVRKGNYDEPTKPFSDHEPTWLGKMAVLGPNF